MAKHMKVRLTFLEEILGTTSGDPEIHEEYIASKAPDAPSREEEIAAIGVDGAIEKAKTIFPKEGGKPFLWDYQVKGFLKAACSALARISGTEASKIKAYKKIIGELVFVNPRKIPLIFDGEIGNCQRPLRAQTAQGERITLANSETCPVGTVADIVVEVLEDKYVPLVKELLAYARRIGFGQWRNSGKGRARAEIVEELDGEYCE
jgi:hypothetical protein